MLSFVLNLDKYQPLLSYRHQFDRSKLNSNQMIALSRLKVDSEYYSGIVSIHFVQIGLSNGNDVWVEPPYRL